MATTPPLTAPATATSVTATPGATTPDPATSSRKSAIFQAALNAMLNPPNILTDAGGSDDDPDEGNSLTIRANFPVL